MKRADRRSTGAASYRAWYWTPRWKAIASAQLRMEPHCRKCAARGLKVSATICDHVERHRGGPVRFWAGPFQSLCKPCHDGPKQREERRGYAVGNDATGRPTDPRHPWNRKS